MTLSNAAGVIDCTKKHHLKKHHLGGPGGTEGQPVLVHRLKKPRCFGCSAVLPSILNLIFIDSDTNTDMYTDAFIVLILVFLFPGPVRQSGTDINRLQKCITQPAESHHVRIKIVVIHPPFFAHFHDPRIFQDLEMMGNSRT